MRDMEKTRNQPLGHIGPDFLLPPGGWNRDTEVHIIYWHLTHYLLIIHNNHATNVKSCMLGPYGVRLHQSPMESYGDLTFVINATTAHSVSGCNHSKNTQIYFSTKFNNFFI